MLKKYSIKKQKAGIKALPINFKGKFLGFAFSILNQFDIYGKVAAEFYDNSNEQFIFSLDGSAASVDKGIKILLAKVVGNLNYNLDERGDKGLQRDITKFLKQVNSEVKNYNSKNIIPAEKKIIKQEAEKIIPPMAHRKKTARKKTAKRKTVHTIPGKVKSYRRKATVKAHTRLVAGIGSIKESNFSSLADFKRVHKEKGYHFFDPKTIKFFKSKMESSLIGGKYFITSEKYGDAPRHFRIRIAKKDGTVETIDQQFTSKENAKEYLNF